MVIGKYLTVLQIPMDPVFLGYLDLDPSSRKSPCDSILFIIYIVLSKIQFWKKYYMIFNLDYKILVQIFLIRFRYLN